MYADSQQHKVRQARVRVRPLVRQSPAAVAGALRVDLLPRLLDLQIEQKIDAQSIAFCLPYRLLGDAHGHHVLQKRWLWCSIHIPDIRVRIQRAREANVLQRSIS